MLQQVDLRKYLAQYGEEPAGLEQQFIQRNDSHLHAMLYRGIEYADTGVIASDTHAGV
jgi:hypothetical protein